MAHKHFDEGQMVSLKSRAHLSPATPMLFKVETKLRNNGGLPQYRIKNTEHDHERVELSTNLVAVGSAPNVKDSND